MNLFPEQEWDADVEKGHVDPVRRHGSGEGRGERIGRLGAENIFKIFKPSPALQQGHTTEVLFQETP